MICYCDGIDRVELCMKYHSNRKGTASKGHNSHHAALYLQLKSGVDSKHFVVRYTQRVKDHVCECH